MLPRPQPINGSQEPTDVKSAAPKPAATIALTPAVMNTLTGLVAPDSKPEREKREAKEATDAKTSNAEGGAYNTDIVDETNINPLIKIYLYDLATSVPSEGFLSYLDRLYHFLPEPRDSYLVKAFKDIHDLYFNNDITFGDYGPRKLREHYFKGLVGNMDNLSDKEFKKEIRKRINIQQEYYAELMKDKKNANTEEFARFMVAKQGNASWRYQMGNLTPNQLIMNLAPGTDNVTLAVGVNPRLVAQLPDHVKTVVIRDHSIRSLPSLKDLETGNFDARSIPSHVTALPAHVRYLEIWEDNQLKTKYSISGMLGYLRYLDKNNDFNNTLSYLNAALEENPEAALILKTRASLYSEQGKQAEALRDYKAALKLEPTNVHLMLICADLVAAMQGLDEAKSFLNLYLQHTHTLDEKLKAIPLLIKYGKRKDLIEGSNILAKALATDEVYDLDDREEAHQLRAKIYLQLGGKENLNLALKELDQQRRGNIATDAECKLVMQACEIYLNRGKIYQAQNDSKSAGLDFKNATDLADSVLKAHSTEGYAWFFKALIALQQNDFKDIDRFFHLAYNFRNKSSLYDSSFFYASSLACAGQADEKRGLSDSALKRYNEAIDKATPQHPENYALWCRANLYYSQGKLDLAEADLKKALESLNAPPPLDSLSTFMVIPKDQLITLVKEKLAKISSDYKKQQDKKEQKHEEKEPKRGVKRSRESILHSSSPLNTASSSSSSSAAPSTSHHHSASAQAVNNGSSGAPSSSASSSSTPTASSSSSSSAPLASSSSSSSPLSSISSSSSTHPTFRNRDNKEQRDEKSRDPNHSPAKRQRR